MSKRDAVHHWLEGDLTPGQVEELRRLEVMGDAGIDTAAIPPAPAEAWRHARRCAVTRADLEAMRRFFRPVKQLVSLRLDADILHWSKERSGGRGWQTGINRALRAHRAEQLAGMQGRGSKRPRTGRERRIASSNFVISPVSGTGSVGRG